MNLRSKAYFFTYPQCDVGLDLLLEHIKLKFNLLEKNAIKWCIASEKHSDGNLHRHAFIGLDSELRAKVDAKHFDFGDFHPNIQSARSAAAVIKYCKKEGDYISNIDPEVNKGTREFVAKQLIGGISLSEIVKQYPQYLFNYQRTKLDLQAFLNDTKEKTYRDSPVGIWISGPSGCGKSTIAQTRMGSVYIKDNNKWWDGYSGQEGVVCEDVDKSWKDILPKFKVWADRYDFPGEIKGGTITLRIKKFIVTSNQTLDEFLSNINWPMDDWEPYKRRFRGYAITSIADWEEQL